MHRHLSVMNVNSMKFLEGSQIMLAYFLVYMHNLSLLIFYYFIIRKRLFSCFMLWETFSEEQIVCVCLAELYAVMCQKRQKWPWLIANTSWPDCILWVTWGDRNKARGKSYEVNKQIIKKNTSYRHEWERRILSSLPYSEMGHYYLSGSYQQQLS